MDSLILTEGKGDFGDERRRQAFYFFFLIVHLELLLDANSLPSVVL